VGAAAGALVALALLASVAAAPARADGPDAGSGIADSPECRACHVTPPHLPKAAFMEQQCGRCHGPELGIPRRVADLSPIQATVGGPERPGPAVHPDPVLAKDFKSIIADMVPVPGGPFVLGDNTRHPDEGPMQPWTVDGFYIDKFEVTNGDYYAFVQAGRRTPPEHWNGPAPPIDLLRHPVTYVSWFDARDYCAWRGKRLPTEFEWEKAARGTEGLKFPWGDVFDPTVANTPQSGIGHTTPVGSFPKGASPYGAMDMAGNVWEWTDSWYKPYPGNTRSNPNYGELYRVVRGGSWYDCEIYRCGISAPTFNRGFFIADTKNDTFGFRCAVSAPPGTLTEAQGASRSKETSRP
jgi:formylglycine-generating enzyme required for sulfatase activity